MKILFITSNRLGDAVLSTGLLDHLIRSYPSARFTIVCGPVAEGVFTHMPNRDDTIVLQKQAWGKHWLPLWARVVATKWDIVIDIRGSALSWLVRTRSRSVFRGGKGPKVAQLGAMLGLSPAPVPVVWTSGMDRRHIHITLMTEQPIVVLAPTANWEPKVWPAERFAWFFHQISIQDALPIVVGGPGPAERAMAQKLLDLLPEALDMVGKLTVPEVVALLERTTLFVGNDSGLMHLAAATGTPTLGLFGPTDAATYGPTGRRATAVIGPSMQAIHVHQVLEAAQRLLAEPH